MKSRKYQHCQRFTVDANYYNNYRKPECPKSLVCAELLADLSQIGQFCQLELDINHCLDFIITLIAIIFYNVLSVPRNPNHRSAFWFIL